MPTYNDLIKAIAEMITHPVRFEIVPQKRYNVYGFEKDSTCGLLYGSFGSQKAAQKRMNELEKYYGVTNEKTNSAV